MLTNLTFPQLKEVFQEDSSFVQITLKETYQDCWIGTGSLISWMHYIMLVQATNHKFQFYEQMLMLYTGRDMRVLQCKGVPTIPVSKLPR